MPASFDPETGEVVPGKTHDHQTLACQIAFAARFEQERLEVATAHPNGTLTYPAQVSEASNVGESKSRP